MKLERSKNAKRNVIFGVGEKFLNIALQFIARSVLLYTLGVEYIGLSTLFASIIGVLSVTELGFGAAIAYSMYQPIAEDDTETVCALMQFYKQCYRVIGTVILVAGLAITPFIPRLVKGELPGDLNLYILYGISLAGTCITYFLYGYKGALLNAFQRADLGYRVSIAMTIGKNLLEIVLLLIFRNYYLFALIVPATNILTNILTGMIVDREFPEYKAKGKLPEDMKNAIICKVKALLCYKVGGVVGNSVDSIVISAYLGLVVLGQYQNYFYIIATLFGLFYLLYNAIRAGIGNMIALEGADKTYEFFRSILFLQAVLVSWCSVCLLCLYQPFIHLWAGEKNLLPFGCVVCIVVYFYQWKMQDIVYIFKEAGGMWEQDKFRPLIAAIVNLSLNLILVRFIGLYGIILSTVISGVLIELPWSGYVLYHQYFKRPVYAYLGKLAQYTGITLCICVPTYLLCSLIHGTAFVQLITRGVLCVTVAPAIAYGLFRWMPEYHGALELVKKFVKS